MPSTNGKASNARQAAAKERTLARVGDSKSPRQRDVAIQNYQKTLEGVRRHYHENKEHLILNKLNSESQTVTWWAELHWNHRHLLNCWYYWLNKGRHATALSMGERVLMRWRNMALTEA